jgi:hypothetical protein
MFITSQQPLLRSQGGVMIRTVPFIVGLLLALMQCASAQGMSAPRDMTVLIYFTGIGCPHCANTDPVLFKQKVRRANLMIVEYEIYQESLNAPLLMNYYFFFDGIPGIPALIAGSRTGQTIMGDEPILKRIDRFIAQNKGNGVTFRDRVVAFDKVRLSDLSGMPKLWFRNRVAVRTRPGTQQSEAVKLFLLSGTVPRNCRPTENKRIALSGDSIVLREACSFDGWTLMRD